MTIYSFCFKIGVFFTKEAFALGLTFAPLHKTGHLDFKGLCDIKDDRKGNPSCNIQILIDAVVPKDLILQLTPVAKINK